MKSMFAGKCHIYQKDNVHQERIDDCGGRDCRIAENERAGCHGNGLRRILHSHLDHNCPFFSLFEPEYQADGRGRQYGRENEPPGQQAISIRPMKNSGWSLHTFARPSAIKGSNTNWPNIPANIAFGFLKMLTKSETRNDRPRSNISTVNMGRTRSMLLNFMEMFIQAGQKTLADFL